MDAEPKELTPAKVRERWENGVKATRTERQTASVNHQFLHNKMWVHWNRGSNRLEEVPRNDRVRASIARIGPDTRIIMAKLTRRSLTFEVPPTAPDDAAMKGSRIGESALAQTAVTQNWEGIRLDHANVTWAGGVGGLVVEWDAQAGTAIGQDPTTGAEVFTGDVKVSCVSLHEMSFEPGTRDGEHARYWVRGQALPPEEVQELYGLEKEPSSDAQALNSVHRVGEGDQASNTPLTMVFTYYGRPTRLLPEGRIVTVVGDQFVADSPWTFPFTDRLNVALAVVTPVHAAWIGLTPVTDAVPIQAAYNASWSSIIEHMKNAGNARLAVPVGSVEDIEDFSDAPGEAFEYSPINGVSLQYLSPPSMPDWWIRQPGMLAEAMDDALSIHAVSRGDAPSGIESGLALSILSENDDTPVGSLARNLGDSWARAATMVLKLYEANVQESRDATIAPSGQGAIPELIKWAGGDLAGQTTVVVPTDSVIPRNRAAQAAYAFQLFDRGIITNPAELAKIADLPDQNSLLEGISPDSARAHRENMWMAAGKSRVVDIYDDHANHIDIIRDFMRSERYENLPDEIKELFVMHATAHEMYAAGQGAQQVQAAGISPIAAVLPTQATQPIPLEMLGAPAATPGQAAPTEGVPAAGTEPPMDEMQIEADNQQETAE